MKDSLVLTIAGGWWWCERCQKNHVECSPCPEDPNYVQPDEAAAKERFDAFVERLKKDEAAGKYLNSCIGCQRIFSNDNKRAVYCPECAGS